MLWIMIENPQKEFWPRGWEEAELDSLRRLAALPMELKLEWLEDAQCLVEQLKEANKTESETP